jgi:alkylhydroperoxidase family enzyme
MFKQLKVNIIRKLARRRLGRDIAPLETIASHPDFLIAYAQFSQALEKVHLVDHKLKVLGQIRAAKLVECPFWIDINSAAGKAAGLSDEQIRNLNWHRESNLFDADQKLVLELADAITATPAQVSEELRERLKKRFSTPQLVELGAAIAWENYRARSNRVFGFGSEGFYQSRETATMETQRHGESQNLSAADKRGWTRINADKSKPLFVTSSLVLPQWWWEFCFATPLCSFVPLCG